ncbi:hypothetical protein [Oceanobacter mangrovi]|uniref:hypothetical protein n=1 Tax=Oceanobacter mangrovi TaxID=2862510 RepID=UPI001C8E2E30|nr:hypothetical protein [Oceanobacter mangrovi]
MSEFEQSSTQSLIDKYYQEEQQRRLREKTQADILVKAEPTDLAMINMIAKRFQKSREELIRDVLSNALIDLFARLEAGERKLLARDADENTRQLAREIAEENGLMDLEVPQGHWAGVEKLVLKNERKRAKDQEKQDMLLDKARQLIAQMEQQESPVEDAVEEEEDDSMVAAAAEDAHTEEVEASESEGDEDSTEDSQPASVF